MIKYFKMTSNHLNSPVYYAAYNLRDAIRFGYSEFNSQFACSFEEVQRKDIPKTSIIRSAMLNRADSRSINRLENEGCFQCEHGEEDWV
jgi:hypothetical protein